MHLRKIIHKHSRRQDVFEFLLNFCTADIVGTSIILDVENGFLVENTRNIEYCYANQAYSGVALLSRREIIVSKPLKYLQELLPEKLFYRVHKSYLINVFFIRKFVKGTESYIILRSGTKIPVSVRISTHISKDLKKMLLGWIRNCFNCW